MSKKRKPTTRKRSTRAKKTRPASRPRPRKTKRPKTVQKRKPQLPPRPPKRRPNPKRISESRKREIKKSASTGHRHERRDQGFGTRVNVTSRLHDGKEVTIKRRVTNFARGIRIARGKGKRNHELQAKALKPAAAHFTKIGKSKSDLYTVKLKYTYKFRGKKLTSYFSVGVAKLKSKTEFLMYMQDALEAFGDSIERYSRGGFSNITFAGVIVQGYE
jgi:hypothetical protein